MSEPGEKSFRDYQKTREAFINFKDENPQRMTFDPNVAVRIFKGGKFGDSPAVPVEKAGKIFWLRIKSKRLGEQLEKVKVRSLIEVQQLGSGFDTDYMVKVISK